MVKSKRAAENPVAYLERGNVQLDRRHDRRALPEDEFTELLAAAKTGPAFRSLSGGDRYFLYLTAAHTGLRLGELASLAPRSFDLTGSVPTVTVEAAYSKHRRQDIQPIRPDLAKMLATFVADKRKAIRSGPAPGVRRGP
jgi:integrase